MGPERLRRLGWQAGGLVGERIAIVTEGAAYHAPEAKALYSAACTLFSALLRYLMRTQLRMQVLC